MKKYLKIILVLLFFTILILLYANIFGTKGLKIKEYTVSSKDLPVSFYGLKVVHFSDLHYGRTINNKSIKTVVDKINMLNPDIVIFTGDLIDQDITITDEMKKNIKENLLKIKSVYGNYFVSGNHDSSFKEYKKFMDESKFINLDDNSDIIYKNKDSILIGGIKSELSKNPKMDIISKNLTDEDVPNFKIIAMHMPDNIKYFKDYNINVVLAGHSHNGQIRFPIIGAIFKPKGAKMYFGEYYRVNNTDLYISSGIGTSTFNVRLFNKPSINLYRFVNK